MKAVVKRIVPLLVLLAAAAGLHAAGGTGEQAATTSLAGVDPTGATVVYWFQHSSSREKALQEMITEFNTANEWKITVKGEFAGGYNDIYNKMITAIAGGTMPDLVVAYQNQAAGYAVSDSLVDLNPYVNDPKWGYSKAEFDDFFEGFISQDVNQQFGGKRLGFPPNRSVEVLYYNADWLKKVGVANPPKTWDDFFEACKRATESGPNKFGYAISTDASNVFSQVISRGGEIAKADGSGYQYNTPQMKASMQFMKRLYDAGYAIKIAERYGDQTDFGSGKVMFTMGSTSGLPFYENAVSGSDTGKFAWSVAPIPHTTANPTLNVYGASVSVPKSTPEKQLAAWLFVKWMSEPKQQARWVEVSNYFPVRKSTAASLGPYLEKNAKFRAAFDLLRNSATKAEPPYSGYDEVRDAVSAAFNAILDGADIDRTLANLDAEANKIHKEASP